MARLCRNHAPIRGSALAGARIGYPSSPEGGAAPTPQLPGFRASGTIRGLDTSGVRCRVVRFTPDVPDWCHGGSSGHRGHASRRSGRARTTSRASTCRCRSASLIVVTGVSGSGKSSLAFDTIYAEGHAATSSRSPYARQFLERMEKPDVERIEGMSRDRHPPEERDPEPRSTVGTTTEIHDYMRLLWARVGRTVCRQCGQEVLRETAEVVARRLNALAAGTRLADRLRDAHRGGAEAIPWPIWTRMRRRSRRTTACRSARQPAARRERPGAVDAVGARSRALRSRVSGACSSTIARSHSKISIVRPWPAGPCCRSSSIACRSTAISARGSPIRSRPRMREGGGAAFALRSGETMAVR